MEQLLFREPPVRECALNLLTRLLELVSVEVVLTDRGFTVAAVEDHGAFDDPVHAELGEIGAPAIERFLEIRAGQMVVPRGGVVERVGVAVRQDPRVAADLADPLERALVRRVDVPHHPAHEQRRPAAVGKSLRGFAHDALRQLVDGQLAVAVHPAGLRRHHERRVARDESELLAGNGREQASMTRLDVLELVQRGVQCGESEGALVDVGRDCDSRVGRREERMDAVAGADVECTPHAWARSEHVAEPRGGRIGRDVVRRIRVSFREAVRRKQQFPGRADPSARDDSAADLREPRRLERLEAARAERPFCVGPRDRLLEEEQTRGDPELRVGQAPREDVHIDRVGRIVVAVEELEQRLFSVPELAEAVAEARARRYIGIRCERGGGGGIRTHEPARASGFQDRPVRPLRHPAARAPSYAGGLRHGAARSFAMSAAGSREGAC